MHTQGHPTMRICLSGSNNLIVEIRLQLQRVQINGVVARVSQ